MNYEIVHHDINKVNYKEIGQCHTIITFRTQQLLDLWLNEMQGQISDGMWENSRNTDWLWSDCYLQLGSETKVENNQTWTPKRVSFGLGSELWDCVGDRILAENGFESKRQAVLAWTEIAQAIKNWKDFSDETRLRVKESQDNIKSIRDKVIKKMNEEWKETGLGFHEQYGYMFRDTLYMNPETKRGCISVDPNVAADGSRATWKLTYNDAKFYIPAGKLVEGIAKLRALYTDWENFSKF